MATAWRSPPDSVPTGWFGSRTSMPIFCISSRMTRFANRASSLLASPKPTVGSEPRKKLRQIDMSGTVARSWNTTEMPAARASRGPPNRTLAPSMRNSPSSCGWTPDRILIRVDLPAPLSPSTHVTSPARTSIEMSFSAITLPKYLLTWRTSRRGAPLWLMASSTAGARGAPPDEGVHAHGDEQDHAEEGEVPVRVPPGEDDADLREADDKGADRRADGGPIAAGQETAADDRGDDEEEFLAHALAGLDALEAQGNHDPDQRRRHRRAHEEDDLRAGDWDAHGASRVGVASDGVDPVAEGRLRQHPRSHNGEGDPPQHRVLEVVRREKGAAEDRLCAGEPGRLVGDVEAHLVRDQERDPDVHAAKDEEGGERDDEARQLGPDYEDSVDRSDHPREDHHHDDPQPHVEVVARDQHAEQQAARADHHAGGKVELAADHEQRDGHRHDPVGRRGVRPVLHARDGRELVTRRGVDGGEQQVDRDRADQRSQLGPLEQAHQHVHRGHALVAGACLARSGNRLGGHAHGFFTL